MKQVSIEPKEHLLRIRAVDRGIFLAIKDGTKSVETRAAKPRYMDVKKGDTLVIVCEGEKMKKIIKDVEHFRSIATLVKAIPYKKINPAVSSVAELTKVYHSFPGYEEKIKQFGLVAWYL